MLNQFKEISNLDNLDLHDIAIDYDTDDSEKALLTTQYSRKIPKNTQFSNSDYSKARYKNAYGCDIIKTFKNLFFTSAIPPINQTPDDNNATIRQKQANVMTIRHLSRLY